MLKDLKDYELDSLNGILSIEYYKNIDGVRGIKYSKENVYSSLEDLNDGFYYDWFNEFKFEEKDFTHSVEYVKFNPKFPEAHVEMINAKNYICSMEDGMVNSIKIIDNYLNCINIKFTHTDDGYKMKTVCRNISVECIEKYENGRKIKSVTNLSGEKVEDIDCLYNETDKEIEETTEDLKYGNIYKMLHKCDDNFKKLFTITYEGDDIYSITKYFYFEDGSHLEITKY